MPGSFLDTNVLLYIVSSDHRKAGRAEELLQSDVTISVQVLNEIANVARRKLGFSWPDVRSFIGMICDVVTVVPLTAEVHAAGLDIAERYGVSVYDAFILAAALLASCDTVWSEDMQDGLLIDKRLRVANPF